MKRNLFILAALLALTSCKQGPTPACEGPTLFVNYATITVDGVLDEQAWKDAPESSQFTDIRGGGELSEMPATMKLLYDENNLYVAGIIVEKDIKASLKERDSIIWKDNDFEVFIDPYGDGKLYYEIEVNAYGTVMDLMMDKPYKDGGNFIMTWDCKGLQCAVGYDGTINDSSDEDNAWYVEMAIPLKSIARGFDNVLEKTEWRMNFSRVEWPVPGEPEENWVWAPTGVLDIHIPDKWGTVTFLPKE